MIWKNGTEKAIENIAREHGFKDGFAATRKLSKDTRH